MHVMALLRRRAPPKASSPAAAKPARKTRAPAAPGRPEKHLPGVLQRLSRAVGFRWNAGPALAPGLTALRELCQTALDQRGQVRGLIAIAQVADAYHAMAREERDGFFDMLAHDFAVDPMVLQAAIAAYRGAAEERQEALLNLTDVLESPRLSLFRQFNTIPHGMKFLLDLQAELLRRLPRQPQLAAVEHDLRHSPGSWFNYGFLELIALGWDTPPAFLEKLIENEAVHHITSWEDLKHRLTGDRRCFAFIHPSMPDEPLIFLEAALVSGIATNIQALLDVHTAGLPPHLADTAVFYSISNAQPGLRGIALGNLLIKEVVAHLRLEFPHLRRFVTLSPMPRLREDFLAPALADGRLAAFFPETERAQLRKLTGADSDTAALAAVLGNGGARAPEAALAVARRGLLRAARQYLTTTDAAGRAACPVAHFHLSNGASLAQIDWMADTSSHGFAQSVGMMVNYVYDMKRFEALQAAYLTRGRISVGRAVKGL